MRTDQLTHLSTDEVSCTFDPDDGCRMTSLIIHGHEVVWPQQHPPFHANFVMAPFAGRIRDGLATWNGEQRRFPTLEDGHAPHGLVHSRPWTRVDDATWEVGIDGDDWFGPCRVKQTARLHADALHLDLEVAADTPVPATIGWHPWFLREIGGATLEFVAPGHRILAKDDRGITTDVHAPVPEQPWDDTFVDIEWPVALRWPGVLDLTIESDAACAVVYTQLPQAVCIEPQTGPPNEVNSPGVRIAAPGHPLRLSTTLRWSIPSAHS